MLDPEGNEVGSFKGEGENLEVSSGAGEGFDVDMYQVADSRSVSCALLVTDADGETVDDGPYLASVIAAPPSCDSLVAPEPKSIRVSGAREGGGRFDRCAPVTCTEDSS